MSEEGEIHVELPRARLGGLQKGPVEDLLRRIARDYARLETENKKLWATLEQLGESTSAAGELPDESPAPSAGSPESANGQVEALLPAQPAAENGLLHARLTEGQPIATGSRREADELATAVLELAHRAARDLRESTRQDCELMIKKTRERAETLQRELERSRELTAAEIEQMQALQREMREHMRASLQAVLRTFVAERAAEPQLLDWSEMPSLFAATEPAGKKSKKKKQKP